MPPARTESVPRTVVYTPVQGGDFVMIKRLFDEQHDATSIKTCGEVFVRMISKILLAVTSIIQLFCTEILARKVLAQ